MGLEFVRGHLSRDLGLLDGKIYSTSCLRRILMSLWWQVSICDYEVFPWTVCFYYQVKFLFQLACDYEGGENSIEITSSDFQSFKFSGDMPHDKSMAGP